MPIAARGFALFPRKNGRARVIAPLLCLWKSCAWCVNAGESLRTLFACSDTGNQRQSRPRLTAAVR